jgi:hypothetical protein
MTCEESNTQSMMEGSMMSGIGRLFAAAVILAIVATVPTPSTAQRQYSPGVTDTEIKVGQTMPYSGPASAWGVIGLAELAYVKMIKDQPRRQLQSAEDG